LDRDFNVFDLKLATKYIKSHKAPGNDLIPNEVWRLGTPNMLLTLRALFQQCFASGLVPFAWCQAVILPLFKEGERSMTTNYRPISLLKTILKLFTITMISRLNTWIRLKKKISQFQAGFKKNTSSLDHIFILNTMIQLPLLRKHKLFVSSIDMSKAFDSTPHNRLWKVLLEIGVSPKWLRVFAYLYENAEARSQHAAA
jgi:hypothetical protein